MKDNLLAKILFSTILIIFIGVYVSYAVIETGTLRIKVVDPDGAALPGATVTISSQVMMGSKSLQTDVNGEVLFVNLSPGVYSAKVMMESFQEVNSTGIRISINKETALTINLAMAAAEAITVTAEYAAVDTTKAVVTEHVSADKVESLPIARDYVGYLQLAAGVNMVPNSQGTDTPEDPAGKGGLNYRDRARQSGTSSKRGSRDNYYFLDGVEVTGLWSQTALMTFNNEAIQEQELITSGVPAEYGGGKGIIANVVTRSGGNDFSGTANIYFQPKSFYLDYGGSDYESSPDPTKLEGYKDNKYDTAFTLGGPIMKDKFWFFVSGQYRKNADEFQLSSSASSTRETVDYSQARKGAFFKLRYKLTQKDSLTFLSFLDYFDIIGSRDKNTPKLRQSKSNYDMGVLSGYYQRLFSNNVIFDARIGHHWWSEQLGPRYEDAGVTDTLYYVPGTYPTIEHYILGGYPNKGDNGSTRDVFSSSLEWYKGDMRFKFGYSYTDERDRQFTSYFWNETRGSLDPNLRGVNFQFILDTGIINVSEFYNQILPALNRYWGPVSEMVDLNNDGVVTADELAAVTFDSMNDKGVNYMRTIDARVGENEVKALRNAFYALDDWKINDSFTLNAGIRFEKHNYYDSEGGTILKEDWLILPRIGLVWDIGAQNKQKLSFFYGHYSDPITFDMIHFAGNISGRVREEQINLYGQWFTYRYRGSPEHRDAVWTPNTKDGLAKEYSFTYERDFGQGLVFSSQLYFRKDRNIIEDYDMGLYTDTIVGDPIWGQYALTYEDFGYPASGPPGFANFFLSNLIGAKRDIWGIDFEVSKRFKEGHNLTFQYSYKDATGNSQSDNNADLQGDLVEIDPRTPWMEGPTPGTINHKVKIFGTYRTTFGLDVGALFYWNSGMKYTESYNFLCGAYCIYFNWPLNDTWTNFAKTGQLTTPSYYQIDLKFNYVYEFSERMNLQLFLDIYNVTNNQAKIDVMYAHNDGSFSYQEVTQLLMPLRFYGGARLKF